MMWEQHTFTFTATDTSTELSFTSLTPGPGVSLGFPDDAEGPALDEVVVVSNKVLNSFTKGANGDILDLNGLLASINAPHDGTAFSGGYLKFLQLSDADTLVQIDANGGGDTYLTVATLVGVDLASSDTANYLL